MKNYQTQDCSHVPGISTYKKDGSVDLTHDWSTPLRGKVEIPLSDNDVGDGPATRCCNLIPCGMPTHALRRPKNLGLAESGAVHTVPRT